MSAIMFAIVVVVLAGALCAWLALAITHLMYPPGR